MHWAQMGKIKPNAQKQINAQMVKLINRESPIILILFALETGTFVISEEKDLKVNNM